MRRALLLLTLAAGSGLATESLAADATPVKLTPEPLAAPQMLPSAYQPIPIAPGMQTHWNGVAPMIVDGYLVYPTNRPTHTLPIYNKHKGPVRMMWDYARSPQHQGEPDGVSTPVGPGSFWTDFKFAYGSSRQFLGSVDSAPVQRQFFNPDLQPGYILRAWHPKKYGYVQ